MGDVRLTITHKNPTSKVIDETTLKNKLRDLGLLGRQFDFYGETSFAPGEKFKELIRTDLNIKEKTIEKRLLSKLFSSYRETFPPVRLTLKTNSELGFDCSPEDVETVTCPNCKAEIKNWSEEIDKWFNDNNYTWNCKNCQTTAPPYKFDYKRLGAFSRQTINIWNIGKGTGKPTTKLLDELKQMTKTEFEYYYVRI